jgi:hypothetical protein
MRRIDVTAGSGELATPAPPRLDQPGLPSATQDLTPSPGSTDAVRGTDALSDRQSSTRRRPLSRPRSGIAPPLPPQNHSADKSAVCAICLDGVVLEDPNGSMDTSSRFARIQNGRQRGIAGRRRAPFAPRTAIEPEETVLRRMPTFRHRSQGSSRSARSRAPGVSPFLNFEPDRSRLDFNQ